jgi:tripartite-type tricarboxylate transporter receptor subunit TctC
MPGFELVTWYGMVARAGTPSPVLEKIAADIAAVVREPALAASLGKEGAQVLAIGPGQFNSYMASEVRKWAGVVKQANIEAQ